MSMTGRAAMCLRKVLGLCSYKCGRYHVIPRHLKPKTGRRLITTHRGPYVVACTTVDPTLMLAGGRCRARTAAVAGSSHLS